MEEAVVTAQGTIIFAIQPMQRGFDEINDGLVTRLATHACNFFACFLFVPAPQVNKYHQHARFNDVVVDRQSLVESSFRTFEIFSAAQALENAIYIARAQTVISQAELRIEFNRAAKVLYRRIAIGRGNAAEYKTGKPITAAQVCFVSFGVDGGWLRQARLLVRT